MSVITGVSPGRDPASDIKYGNGLVVSVLWTGLIDKCQTTTYGVYIPGFIFDTLQRTFNKQMLLSPKIKIRSGNYRCILYLMFCTCRGRWFCCRATPDRCILVWALFKETEERYPAWPTVCRASQRFVWVREMFLLWAIFLRVMDLLTAGSVCCTSILQLCVVVSCRASGSPRYNAESLNTRI